MTTTKITTHQADALNRLLAQYRGKPLLAGLLNSLTSGVQGLENMFFDVLAARSVAAATGAQLDALGTVVGLTREPGWSDSTYRGQLFTEIAVNTGQGTPEAVITAFGLYTGSTEVNYYEYRPADVALMGNAQLTDPGLLANLQTFLQAILSAGVSIDSYGYFDPTDAFELGDVNAPATLSGPNGLGLALITAASNAPGSVMPYDEGYNQIGSATPFTIASTSVVGLATVTLQQSAGAPLPLSGHVKLKILGALNGLPDFTNVRGTSGLLDLSTLTQTATDYSLAFSPLVTLSAGTYFLTLVDNGDYVADTSNTTTGMVDLVIDDNAGSDPRIQYDTTGVGVSTSPVNINSSSGDNLVSAAFRPTANFTPSMAVVVCAAATNNAAKGNLRAFVCADNGSSAPDLNTVLATSAPRAVATMAGGRGANVEFLFTSASALTSGTTYWLVIFYDGVDSPTNPIVSLARASSGGLGGHHGVLSPLTLSNANFTNDVAAVNTFVMQVMDNTTPADSLFDFSGPTPDGYTVFATSGANFTLTNGGGTIGGKLAALYA